MGMSCKAENIAWRERQRKQHEREATTKDVLPKEVDVEENVSPPLCPAALRAHALLATRKLPSAPPVADDDPTSQ